MLQVSKLGSYTRDPFIHAGVLLISMREPFIRARDQNIVGLSCLRVRYGIHWRPFFHPLFPGLGTCQGIQPNCQMLNVVWTTRNRQPELSCRTKACRASSGQLPYDCCTPALFRPKQNEVFASINETTRRGADMGYADRPPLEGTNPRRAQEFSPHENARDLDARSDQRIGLQPRKASIHYINGFGRKGTQAVSDQASIGRRIARTLIRFLIAVLIGVGATLAWQSDSAKQMVAARAPTLAGLLSISAPVVAAPSPDQTQQIELLATDLYIVRRGLEQITAKQDQMAQNIAALQAVEEDIRQKMASTPSSSSQPASVPEQKLPQPRAHSAGRPSTVAHPAGPLVLTR